MGMQMYLCTPPTEEEAGEVVYLRDVTRLVGTRAQLQRRAMSGEIITNPDALRVRDTFPTTPSLPTPLDALRLPCFRLTLEAS